MKRILILATAAITGCLYANAQESEFKSGENSLEIGFNPFSENFKTFRIDELKYRHFFGKNALRVRAGFGLNKSSNETTDNTQTIASSYTSYPTTSTSHPDIVDDPYTTVKKTTDKSWNVNLLIGYERHFDVSKRLSLYVGAEIGYECYRDKTSEEGSKTGHTDTQIYSSTKKIYYLASANTYNSQYTKEVKNSGGYNAIIADVFTGIDFHIYKGLYLGAELGLAFNHKSYIQGITTAYDSKTIETSMTYDSNGSLLTSNRNTTIVAQDEKKTVTTNKTEDLKNNKWTNNVSTQQHDEDVKKTETSVKLDVMPALRIGWRF